MSLGRTETFYKTTYIEYSTTNALVDNSCGRNG